jgi:hypothetical protein
MVYPPSRSPSTAVPLRGMRPTEIATSSTCRILLPASTSPLTCTGCSTPRISGSAALRLRLRCSRSVGCGGRAWRATPTAVTVVVSVRRRFYQPSRAISPACSALSCAQAQKTEVPLYRRSVYQRRHPGVIHLCLELVDRNVPVRGVQTQVDAAPVGDLLALQETDRDVEKPRVSRLNASQRIAQVPVPQVGRIAPRYV